MMDLDTLFNQHNDETDVTLEGLAVPPFEDLQRRQRIRSTRIVGATFGVVAALAGVALLLTRSDTLPVAEESSTTSVTTTTVVTDDPVALTGVELIASQWTSHKLGIDSLGVIGNRSVSYIESKGFFIAGTNWTRGNDWFRGRLWRSEDGADWGVVPGSGTIFPERVGLVEVLAGDEGMITWGAGVVAGTTVWISADGTNWTVSAEVAAPEPRGGLILGSGEYLLYGGEDPDAGSTGKETGVLLSADGVNWDIISVPVVFTAIVQLDSGRLVATGGQASEPLTWISADGRSWSPLSDDHSITQETGMAVNKLVVAGPGLVAGGTNAEGEAALWVSTDGQVFEQVVSFGPNGPQGGWPNMEEPPTIAAIAVGKEWIVAVGGYGAGGDQARGIGGGAIWISQDGIDWESVPVDLLDRRGTGLSDVAYGAATFVAIGSRNDEPLVLSWEPSSP